MLFSKQWCSCNDFWPPSHGFITILATGTSLQTSNTLQISHLILARNSKLSGRLEKAILENLRNLNLLVVVCNTLKVHASALTVPLHFLLLTNPVQFWSSSFRSGVVRLCFITRRFPPPIHKPFTQFLFKHFIYPGCNFCVLMNVFTVCIHSNERHSYQNPKCGQSISVSQLSLLGSKISLSFQRFVL